MSNDFILQLPELVRYSCNLGAVFPAVPFVFCASRFFLMTLEMMCIFPYSAVQ